MMSAALYFTKQDLAGIPKGHVERFRERAAAPLLREGAIEPFDEKNKKHRDAPGSPESEIKARAAAAIKTKELQEAQRELHRRQFGA